MYLGSCQLDAAYLGSCKLDKIYLGVCEVLSGEPAPAVPVFDALTPVNGLITGVKTGAGGVTSSRASSSWQPDYLGVPREFGNNEPAIRGARVEGAVGSRECYVEDDNWWYVAEPESTNYFLQSFTPSTQDVTRTGEHTVSVVGSGSVTLTGGLSGTVTEGTPITGDPAGVAVTFTVAGSLFSVNFEPGSVATSPIETTTGTATRPADALQFDLANHDQARGCYTVELIPVKAPYSILSTRAGNYIGLLYDNNNVSIRSNDGSSVISSTANFDPNSGSRRACGLVYDGAEVKYAARAAGEAIGVEGVYDGAFIVNLGALQAGFGQLAPLRIRNIKRYDVPYDEGKEILEALT